MPVTSEMIWRAPNGSNRSKTAAGSKFGEDSMLSSAEVAIRFGPMRKWK